MMENAAVFRGSHDTAITPWRAVANQLQTKFPQLAVLTDSAESVVLAPLVFSRTHRVWIHSTNPLEEINAEIRCRKDIVCAC